MKLTTALGAGLASVLIAATLALQARQSPAPTPDLRTQPANWTAAIEPFAVHGTGRRG